MKDIDKYLWLQEIKANYIMVFIFAIPTFIGTLTASIVLGILTPLIGTGIATVAIAYTLYKSYKDRFNQL